MNSIKQELFTNLEKIESKIVSNNQQWQYINLNSTTSKITFKEGFPNKTDIYHLTVEVMIKVDFENNLLEMIKVQEFFLFMNDGEDVKKFNFSIDEIERFLNNPK